ncbi:hypothetical protein [Dokdonella sp.]|uniref:hypothetical protein n=1 Tax=Dokdonella sp. TaxID=2291710 RepID=UPI002F42457B
METQKEAKLFAFKLAGSKNEVRDETTWKVREDVANAAMCTGLDGDVRYRINPRTDGGVYC